MAAMDRSWSGDSDPHQRSHSPLLGKPSYVATFQDDHPARAQGRRSSVPVKGDAAASTSTDRAIQERRKFRDGHIKHAGGSSSLNVPAGPSRRSHSATRKRAAAGAATSTTDGIGSPRPASPNPGSTTHHRPRSTTQASADTAYSSTYGAGPSEENSYDEDAVSDDLDSSSETEQFQWDTKQRRESAPAPASGGSTGLLRGYLDVVTASATGKQHIPRAPSPLGVTRRGSPQVGSAGRAGQLRGEGTATEARGVAGTTGSSPARGTASAKRGVAGSSSNRNSWQQGYASPSHTGKPSRANSLPPPTKPWKTFNATMEMLLLAGTGLWACWQLSQRPEALVRYKAGELAIVVILSVVYFLLSRQRGLIWSTEPRSYRSSDDDGSMCGLLLGPILATTMLLISLKEMASTPPSQRSPNGDPLPLPPWYVEAPIPILGNRIRQAELRSMGMSTMALSRSTLVSLQTLISIIFLIHLVATKRFQKRPEIKQTGWHRSRSYVIFSSLVTAGLYGSRELLGWYGVPLWTGLARWEVVTAAVSYQTNMYTISRLGRRSFTLGELGIVASLGVTLMLESIHLTLAKLFPNDVLYLKTFRRATPLLIFQLALIVGTFFIGFCLSSVLYLSRHLAQKPVHRLRWPHQRDLFRQLLAATFYIISIIAVMCVLGPWVGWLFGGHTYKRAASLPWIWTAYFVVGSKHWWTRPVLIVYWIVWISASIIGWTAVVSRAKRFRSNKPTSSANGTHNEGQAQSSAPSKSLSATLQAAAAGVARNRKASPNANGGAGGSGDTGNATPVENGVDHHPTASALANKFKKPTHLSLNARRKFFHALAVVLYTPGIAIDVSSHHRRCLGSSTDRIVVSSSPFSRLSCTSPSP